MKVFISSTYKDLIDYRAAAIEAVERTKYQTSKMEVFGARSEEPLKACLKEIEESQIFVGIYALRYGFVPKDSEISITEMEYLHAKTKSKIIFCFVLDEENQPWLTKFIEEEPGKSKLKDLKQRIQTDHIVDFFTTPDDLGMKVATALSRHLTELTPLLDSPPPIYEHPKPTGSTLPRLGYFVGREKELETIAVALSPETRAWGALIDGPGGIGKTALAIKAAHDASDELFERKIFITAKVRELTPEGERKITDFTRLDYLAMLNELALELGDDSISKLPPEERTNALRLALAGQKALIIFDNLETLPDEERTRLFQFLSRLPDGNKAIVTSRRRSDVDARIVRLDRLSRDEAMLLIEELAKKYPRLQRAHPKERDELYEITQGNPLFIRWIAGQLGREGSHLRTIADAIKFIDKAPEGNDPLEYIFGDLLETFTENETKVLAALTHFHQPTKPKWVVNITNLPKRVVETTLEDLGDRSILVPNFESQTFFLPPLTAKFIRARHPETVIQTGDVLTQRAYTLTLQFGGGSEDYEKFPTLDAEWNFINSALPRLITDDNDRLQTVCAQLFQFLNFTGRWDDILWLSIEAEAHALADDDRENAGWQAYRAGTVYHLRSQPDKVLACANRAAEHWKDSHPRLQAIAIDLRGHGHKLGEDYPAAITAYLEVVEIIRSISLESEDVTIALNSLADAERISKDYKSAERNYREALRIAKIVNYQEGVVYLTGNLALLAFNREQWAEAESLAREALPLAEKVGRQELIASDCHRIAQALLAQNKDLDEALSLSRRAIEIYTHLRVPDDLKEAQKTLAEIEEKIKENGEY